MASAGAMLTELAGLRYFGAMFMDFPFPEGSAAAFAGVGDAWCGTRGRGATRAVRGADA